LDQDFSDWEVVASDDCSTDDTYSVLQSVGDDRIRCFQQDHNLGYPGNLSSAVSLARGEIVFLLGQDDLLLPGSLRRTIEAFDLGENIGAVTRPYYWFCDDSAVAVRVVRPYRTYDAVFSLSDGPEAVRAVFSSLGQLSGLAIRKSLIRVDFHEHVFTSHVYPVADVLARSRGVFLCRPTVAVRIESSQTRFQTQIYDPPPLQTWIQMAKTIYRDSEYESIRIDLLTFLGESNFVDLVQIRNYSTWSIFFREIGTFVKLRPRNLVDFRFLAVVFISLVTPRSVLRKLVDIYKKHILSRILYLKRFDTYF
jgi:glycosyltransferase involved in cell wall biosynthesis